MLTPTIQSKQKVHPRPRVKKTYKYSEEIKAFFIALGFVLGMEVFNYTIFALKFVYHVF